MSLSFAQIVRLVSEAPSLIEDIRRAIPVVLPVVRKVTALVEELGLDKGETPDEIIDRLVGSFSPEEKALFDRLTKI